MKIDDNWELQITRSCITLVEVRPVLKKNAKNKIARIERGFYADIKQALEAYLIKSINPVDDVREVLAKIDWALEMVKEYMKKEDK